MLTEIDNLQFSSLNKKAIQELKKQGIVTFGQLVELVEKRSKYLKNFNINCKKVREECQSYSQKMGQESFAFTHKPLIIPPMGMVLNPNDNEVIMQRRFDTKQERQDLTELAHDLEPELPDEYFLMDKMQAIRNQGNLGSCVGFGSISAREFLVQKELSPGYGYRGAKMIDGYPNLEGSWQEFSFEFMYRYGAVTEKEYSYQKCLNNECIKPYLNKAKEFKINGYVDLMVSPENLALVLKAALSGHLVPEIGSRPVSISLELYESFCDWSAYTTGLIPVPIEGEKTVGGHAMCVAGYTTLYGVKYFIVSNSWGKDFAKDSPLELPGYALIPEAYIAKGGLTHELIIPY